MKEFSYIHGERECLFHLNEPRLHAGPFPFFGNKEDWQRIANTIAFFERNIPGEMFTLTLDPVNIFGIYGPERKISHAHHS